MSLRSLPLLSEQHVTFDT